MRDWQPHGIIPDVSIENPKSVCAMRDCRPSELPCSRKLPPLLIWLAGVERHGSVVLFDACPHACMSALSGRPPGQQRTQTTYYCHAVSALVDD